MQIEHQHWPVQLELIYQWLHICSVSMMVSSYRSVYRWSIRKEVQLRPRWENLETFHQHLWPDWTLETKATHLRHLRLPSSVCVNSPHLCGVSHWRECHTAGLTCKVERWVSRNHRKSNSQFQQFRSEWFTSSTGSATWFTNHHIWTI